MADREQAKNKNASKTKVRKVNGFVMTVVYHVVRFYFFLCGVRVKAVNKVGKPEKPSIILCNHGSFIDFIYAAALWHGCIFTTPSWAGFSEPWVPSPRVCSPRIWKMPKTASLFCVK